MKLICETQYIHKRIRDSALKIEKSREVKWVSIAKNFFLDIFIHFAFPKWKIRGKNGKRLKCLRTAEFLILAYEKILSSKSRKMTQNKNV
jgi:hypothetical protein